MLSHPMRNSNLLPWYVLTTFTWYFISLEEEVFLYCASSLIWKMATKCFMLALVLMFLKTVRSEGMWLNIMSENLDSVCLVMKPLFCCLVEISTQNVSCCHKNDDNVEFKHDCHNAIEMEIYDVNNVSLFFLSPVVLSSKICLFLVSKRKWKLRLYSGSRPCFKAAWTELVCSEHTCVGFVWALWLQPTVQKHAPQDNSCF